jgi:hypothetical protein
VYGNRSYANLEMAPNKRMQTDPTNRHALCGAADARR